MISTRADLTAECTSIVPLAQARGHTAQDRPPARQEHARQAHDKSHSSALTLWLYSCRLISRPAHEQCRWVELCRQARIVLEHGTGTTKIFDECSKQIAIVHVN